MSSVCKISRRVSRDQSPSSIATKQLVRRAVIDARAVADRHNRQGWTTTVRVLPGDDDNLVFSIAYHWPDLPVRVFSAPVPYSATKSEMWDAIDGAIIAGAFGVSPEDRFPGPLASG
jgi:hypothetical protein